MDIGETLYVARRSEWRKWLARHHADRAEIWLIYPLKATGRPRIAYNDAVEEALCFGWIDSTVKRLNEGERVQRFSPRRPGSNWSQTNKERMARLLERRAVIPEAVPDPVEVDPTAFEFPEDIIAALQADPDAWRHFQSFSEPYKRIRLAYVDHARSVPDEFQKRLANFLAKTARGIQYGNDIRSFY